MRGSLGNTRRSAASQGPKNQFVFRDEFNDGELDVVKWSLSNPTNLHESGAYLWFFGGGTVPLDSLATAITYAQVNGRIWESLINLTDTGQIEVKLELRTNQHPNWFTNQWTKLFGTYHTPASRMVGSVASAKYRLTGSYLGKQYDTVRARAILTNPGMMVFHQSPRFPTNCYPGGTHWMPISFSEEAIFGGVNVYLGLSSYSLDGKLDYVRCFDRDFGLPTFEINTASPSGPYTLTSPDACAILEFTYAAGETCYLHFRRQDGTNYLRAGADASGNLDFDKVVAGTPTTLDTEAGAFSDGVTYRIAVNWVEDSVTVTSCNDSLGSVKDLNVQTEATFNDQLGLDVSSSGAVSIDKLMVLTPWNPPY